MNSPNQMAMNKVRREKKTTHTETHTHTKPEGTAPETSINPHRFSVAEQLLLSPWIISTEHSLWITVNPERHRNGSVWMRANSYTPVQEWEHKNPGKNWNNDVYLFKSLGRLFRGIHTWFIIISTGKWEVIYFYNLATYMENYHSQSFKHLLSTQ